MNRVIGWLGATLLALCGMPQAYESIVNQNSDGISWGFLLMWFLGEIFTLIYITTGFKVKNILPLIFNYGLNIIFISIIIWFKL